MYTLIAVIEWILDKCLPHREVFFAIILFIISQLLYCAAQHLEGIEQAHRNKYPNTRFLCSLCRFILHFNLLHRKTFCAIRLKCFHYKSIIPFKLELFVEFSASFVSLPFLVVFVVDSWGNFLSRWSFF